MKKFFTNGIFAVKWLLRLFPFILFFGLFVYCILVKYNISSDLSISILDFFDNFDNVLKLYMVKICNFYVLGSSQIHLIIRNIIQFIYGRSWSETLIQASGFQLFPVITLWYELMLSLLFLIFNVLNYMFTICNRFLSKGENLYE